MDVLHVAKDLESRLGVASCCLSSMQSEPSGTNRAADDSGQRESSYGDDRDWTTLISLRHPQKGRRGSVESVSRRALAWLFSGVER